jgi:thiamine biosynthesis lipoprotein
MRILTTIATLVLLFQACQNEPDAPASSYLVAEGKTMGTYYRVTYDDSLNRDFSREIDSLLVAINDEISTYIPESTISRFNRAESNLDLGLEYKDFAECLEDLNRCAGVPNTHFLRNFLAARVAYARTNGAFDPTIMPLVNYWGFGYTPKKAVTNADSLVIDSLLQYVGFDKVTLKADDGPVLLLKSDPGVQLDFGGTGQGYGIDAVADYLEWKGIKNYLVDIGGECRARGLNPHGKLWTIGINTPKSEAEVTEFTRIIQLKDMSVSTSGNYRNFYEVHGQKYSHFISPKTGFPEKSTLLSASVFGKDCLLPDALATGFMVMGLDAAYLLADELEDIEALFIYSDENGQLQVKYTPGVEAMLVE